ncbi:MAG: hypothetical protein ACR2P2_02505 [Nakamurella sp.]
MAGEARILDIGEHVVTVMRADGRAAQQVDQLGELRDPIRDGRQGIRGVVDDDRPATP